MNDFNKNYYEAKADVLATQEAIRSTQARTMFIWLLGLSSALLILAL